MSNLYTAPVCEMKKLSNLFIELTAKNCNQRCKNCYIKFPLSKNVKDFIQIDTIKEALSGCVSGLPDCIYLTGAEPMTHPDFNSILRLCLKYSNVCVCTNGSFINEKKARFLKKIEDESNFELIFQLSTNHYDEIKNDNVRYRGAFRQAICAMKNLVKYGFNPIFCITDSYNEGRDKLISGMKLICLKNGFNAQDNNFKVNMSFDESVDVEQVWADINLSTSFDCQYGRILTSKGLYTCPFLANDHRGRSGSDLNDFARKNSLETEFCASCIKNKHSYFSLDFSLF